jgi:predicted O-linked N-acetylglucosamine transferase (SPINDLY family)
MMHVGNHRLLVFARKPAPVQITYLAYPGSTGLETMDYRLTDRFLDPPAAADDAGSSEEPVRLPHCFWCYTEPAEAPEVGKLPASGTGVVTFGSLNGAMKINDDVAAAWGRVLGKVEGWRLLVHSYEGPEREGIARRLKRNGVDLGRVRFAGRMSLVEYFSRYNEIDVGLDTFPYPGGTTTCDALWMGVPVVTLGGRTALSRGGVSILSNVGMSELIAWNLDEYVEKAADLAWDPVRLGEIRAGLRERMRRSALMDARAFVQGVEGAYRRMWEKWCAEGKAI